MPAKNLHKAYHGLVNINVNLRNKEREEKVLMQVKQMKQPLGMKK